MMVQAYSYRADGSVNPVHLPGCALITGSAMVCTCAEIEREQVAGLPDLDEWQQGMARLGAAVTEVSKSLGSLALLIKLHGWLVNKRQVDAETVALAAVGRLPVTVTGVLVQVDLRPDRPPYVVLREEYGSEIPVAPESVRMHVNPRATYDEDPHEPQCNCGRPRCAALYCDDQQSAGAQTEPKDVEAREHMRRCPDHEVTIDSTDQWICVTCEGSDVE